MVQGSHNVVALSNLLAALIGALPNAISGSNSARVLLTGVAARRVGVYAGAIMIVFAALPKAIALAVAIPRPVLVAYVVFMMSAMFVDGMRMALSDGMSGKKATIIGVSLWLGVGFGSSLIFPDLLTGSLGTLLSSGVTIGAVCVIAAQRALRPEFEEGPKPAERGSERGSAAENRRVSAELRI